MNKASNITAVVGTVVAMLPALLSVVTPVLPDGMGVGISAILQGAVTLWHLYAPSPTAPVVPVIPVVAAGPPQPPTK